MVSDHQDGDYSGHWPREWQRLDLGTVYMDSTLGFQVLSNEASGMTGPAIVLS